MSQPKSNETQDVWRERWLKYLNQAENVDSEAIGWLVAEFVKQNVDEALAQKDAEVAEAVNEALLTKAQYAELARGWGAEGSDRYEGYIQGAMDVNSRVFWNLAGKGIAVDMGLTTPKE